MERIADQAVSRLGLKLTVADGLQPQDRPDRNSWILQFRLEDGRALEIRIKLDASETNESIRDRIERALKRKV
jgi:hypothetical protein